MVGLWPTRRGIRELFEVRIGQQQRRLPIGTNGTNRNKTKIAFALQNGQNHEKVIQKGNFGEVGASKTTTRTFEQVSRLFSLLSVKDNKRIASSPERRQWTFTYEEKGVD